MTTEDEIAALKAATREAHEAIKDLRAATKLAKETEDHVVRAMTQVWANGVDTVVKQGLENYQTLMLQAIRDGQAAVYARFDALADVLLGEDQQSVRKGDESLAELIMRLRRGGR